MPPKKSRKTKTKTKSTTKNYRPRSKVINGERVTIASDGYTADGYFEMVQGRRTPQAKNSDSGKIGRVIFVHPVKPEDAAKWGKYPGRYDIEGIDAPMRSKSQRTSKNAGSLNSPSYNKKIIEKNQNHILSQFNAKECGTRNRKEAFVEQIDHMIGNSRITPEQAIREWVKEGCALIYYIDVQDYLSKDLKLPQKRKYDDHESWDLYVHMLTRDGSKLYHQAKKELKTPKKKTASKTNSCRKPAKKVASRKKPASKKPVRRR